jgi:hypothetical protein
MVRARRDETCSNPASASGAEKAAQSIGEVFNAAGLR